MPRFLLIHEGQRILLQEGETLIGRSLSCDVRFNDPAVSRQHLRLVVMDGRAALANLSTSGASVNGERIDQPRRLFDGDLIRFGYQRIRFEVTEDDDAATSSPISPPAGGDDDRRSTDKLRIDALARAAAVSCPRWCEGFVFVTSRNKGSSTRRPVP